MSNMLKQITSAAKLLNEGFGRYKPQILILSALGFVSGLLEVVGINAIIPLFSFITNNSQPGTDLVSRSIAYFFSVIHIPLSIASLLVFIIILFLLKSAILIGFHHINNVITADYERQTRDELFTLTLTAHWPFLMKQKIGHLEKVLMTDITQGTMLLKYLSGFILLASSLVMYVLVAFSNSAMITGMTLAMGAVMFLVLKPILSRTKRIAYEFVESNKIISNLINEHMIGVKTVKAAGQERPIAARADELFRRIRNQRIRIGHHESIINVITQPVEIIFVVVIFAISYQLPSFTFASFAVTIYLIQKMFLYIQSAQSKIHTINTMVPHLRASTEFRKAAASNQEQDPGTEPFRFEKTLQFRGVHFSYETAPVLSSLDLTINKGEMIGLVGASGAGKTTIFDLLLRLLRPASGQILLTDYGQIRMDQWRKNVGYVSQDIFLLNDSIENNIRFYDRTVSHEDMVRAAKLANIHEFIMAQPRGFASPVGERGSLLSGGQKQRIILARVLAKQPQILLLDEATSALDNESETAIKNSIINIKGKITVIIIAHRLTTVDSTDRIIVLDRGAIKEEGSPAELLANSASYFHKVYNLNHL